MMRILVTGGCGYIGSHTTVQLIAAGHDVVIVDNFSRSKRSVVERLQMLTGATIDCREFDLRDQDAIDAVLSESSVDAVIHFAGLKAVGESVARPLEYYENNLGSTISLLRAMRRGSVRKLVFSSSATVYGESAPVPMMEQFPTSANNPYGWTKVMQEQILRDVAAADRGMRIALLRYFNPVGAHPSGMIGEDPQGTPNNLMPLLAQVAAGRRENLRVFGRDYPTPDGTARRDYLHVEDLAAGHLAALERLSVTNEPVSIWNLGTGAATSVLEMVSAFRTASGREIPLVDAPRRPGDIAESYADPSNAARELGWTAARDLQDMCADTWRWQEQNPQGFPDVP